MSCLEFRMAVENYCLVLERVEKVLVIQCLGESWNGMRENEDTHAWVIYLLLVKKRIMK